MTRYVIVNGKRVPAPPEYEAMFEADAGRAAQDRQATNDDINAERDRRVAQGVQAGTTTGKTVNVDTRDDRDFRNIAGLVQQATIRTIASDTTQMAFRGSDNVVTRLTPAEMIEVGAQVAAHVDAVYQASWAVKALINASPPLEKDGISAAFDAALGA